MYILFRYKSLVKFQSFYNQIFKVEINLEKDQFLYFYNLEYWLVEVDLSMLKALIDKAVKEYKLSRNMTIMKINAQAPDD